MEVRAHVVIIKVAPKGRGFSAFLGNPPRKLLLCNVFKAVVEDQRSARGSFR